VLGGVWGAAILYCALSPGLSARHCSLREDPASPLGLASLALVLLLPVLLGPLAVLLAQPLLPLLARCGQGWSPGTPGCGPRARPEGLGPRMLCLALLTAILLATYSTGLLVAELAFPALLPGITHYVLLKFCLGGLHHLLSPLAILASHPRLRAAARTLRTRPAQPPPHRAATPLTQ
jgi:hypothetical protein